MLEFSNCPNRPNGAKSSPTTSIARSNSGWKARSKSAKDVQRRWLNELDSPTPQHPARIDAVETNHPIHDRRPLAAAAGLLWLKAPQEKLGTLDAAQERAGWMFIMPWLAGFLALTLGPMVLSFLLRSPRWSGLTPLGDAALRRRRQLQGAFHP